MKPNFRVTSLIALMAATSLGHLTSAILVQPYNYMLDDSALIGNQPDGGSLSPFYNDQSGSSENGADKDIVTIIGDRLARIRYARMLDNQDEATAAQSQLSQEMADLIQSEQAAASKEAQQEASLSSSMANMLLNVASQVAAQSPSEAASSGASHPGDSAEQSGGDESSGSQNGNGAHREPVVTSRGSIVEMDTSPSAASSVSVPSKADLKSGTRQWYNPKETIPVLKISSMATPSKYKKVYFRSEKKLVDGAFHSLPSSEQEEKKSLLKSPFNSGVQRRSSKGTGSSAAPPSPLQDGVIDFLKKFRDVYIQTRPVNSASGSSAASLASSVVSAAASSPFASFIAPSSSGSRPNLASALSAASSMVAQATSGAGSSSSSSPDKASTATGGSAAGSSNAIKSPLSAQNYVSFWSKTFPTWVRKMLKQLRRRSLYNSSKRQQHQHQHSHSASSVIGQAAQAAASGAVASVVEQASASSGSNSNSASSSSQSSSH